MKISIIKIPVIAFLTGSTNLLLKAFILRFGIPEHKVNKIILFQLMNCGTLTVEFQAVCNEIL